MVKYFVIPVVLIVVPLAALTVALSFDQLTDNKEHLTEGFEMIIYSGIRLIDYLNNGSFAPLFERLPVIQVMCDVYWQFPRFCAV